MHKIVTTTLVAGAATLGVVAAAPAAQAAIPPGVSVPGAYWYTTPCPGKAIGTVPLRNEAGAIRGYTRVTYTPGGGGSVCAATYDNAPGTHGETVTLRNYSLRETASDRGLYAHYAGGVVSPRSNAHCFTVSGSVNYGTGRYNQYSGSWNFCRPGQR